MSKRDPSAFLNTCYFSKKENNKELAKSIFHEAVHSSGIRGHIFSPTIVDIWSPQTTDPADGWELWFDVNIQW
jgi:hypothetical protein